MHSYPDICRVSTAGAPGGIWSSMELQAALFDPATTFATPWDVVKHEGLAAQQKIEILRRWAHDAAEQAVAVDEGMQGAEDDLLRQTLLALAQLKSGVDVEHVGRGEQQSSPED